MNTPRGGASPPLWAPASPTQDEDPSDAQDDFVTEGAFIPATPQSPGPTGSLIPRAAPSPLAHASAGNTAEIVPGKANKGHRQPRDDISVGFTPQAHHLRPHATQARPNTRPICASPPAPQGAGQQAGPKTRSQDSQSIANGATVDPKSGPELEILHTPNQEPIPMEWQYDQDYKLIANPTHTTHDSQLEGSTHAQSSPSKPQRSPSKKDPADSSSVGFGGANVTGKRCVQVPQGTSVAGGAQTRPLTPGPLVSQTLNPRRLLQCSPKPSQNPNEAQARAKKGNSSPSRGSELVNETPRTVPAPLGPTWATLAASSNHSNVPNRERNQQRARWEVGEIPNYNAQGDAVLNSIPPPAGATPSPAPWQYGIVSLYLPAKGFGFITPAKRPGHKAVERDIHFYTSNIIPKCQSEFRRFMLVRFIVTTIKRRRSAKAVTTVRRVPTPTAPPFPLSVHVPYIEGVIVGFDPASGIGVVSPLVKGKPLISTEFPFRPVIKEEFTLPHNLTLQQSIALLESATADGNGNRPRVKFSLEMPTGHKLTACGVSIIEEADHRPTSGHWQQPASAGPMENLEFATFLHEEFDVRIFVGTHATGNMAKGDRVVSHKELRTLRMKLGITPNDARLSDIELYVTDNSSLDGRATNHARDLGGLREKPYPGAFLIHTQESNRSILLTLNESMRQYATASLVRRAFALVLLDRSLTPANFYRTTEYNNTTSPAGLPHLRGVHFFSDTTFSPNEVGNSQQPILLEFSTERRDVGTLAPTVTHAIPRNRDNHINIPGDEPFLLTGPNDGPTQIIIQATEGQAKTQLLHVLAAFPGTTWPLSKAFTRGHAACIMTVDHPADVKTCLTALHNLDAHIQAAPMVHLFHGGETVGAIRLGPKTDADVVRAYLAELGANWSILTGPRILNFDTSAIDPKRLTEVITSLNTSPFHAAPRGKSSRSSKPPLLVTHVWKHATTAWCDMGTDQDIPYSPTLPRRVRRRRRPAPAVPNAILIGPFPMHIKPHALQTVIRSLGRLGQTDRGGHQLGAPYEPHRRLSAGPVSPLLPTRCGRLQETMDSKNIRRA